MPKDFRVDRTTGNIYFDRLVEGIEFTEQSLWIRLGMWVGDWALNNTLFIDWGLALSYQPPRLPELYSQIRSTALGTYGIATVDQLLATPDTDRRLRIKLECGSIYQQNILFDEVFGPL